MFIDLLIELKKKQINITFSNCKLNFSGPKENIDNELLQKLKENRGKLIKHFWPLKNSNLIPITTEGNKRPFIMVHGEMSDYFISSILADRPFFSFFHKGSDGERIKHKTVNDFVVDYQSSLEILMPDGPFLLGGYSFGGIIAFELACKLQNKGKEVPFLILIDVVPPNFNSFIYEAETLYNKKSGWQFINFLIITYYRKAYYRIRRFLWNIITILPIKIKPELRKAIIIDKYNYLLRKYKPINKYNGKLLLFLASENPRPIENYHEWLNFCDELEIIQLKGNHDTIMKNPESIIKLQTTIKDKMDNSLV